jgi:hypothetical protein
MGQYEDDQARQNERENASVLHVLLTPFRMAIELVKWVGVLALLLIWYVVCGLGWIGNQVGWVVDLGDRSETARIALNNKLESYHFYNYQPVGSGADNTRYAPQVRAKGLSVFDVDFRSQPDPTDRNLGSENRFWDDDRTLAEAQYVHLTNEGLREVNWKTKAFATSLQWGDDSPGEGIPYCIVAIHPDRSATSYDATPGSWSTRTADVLDRKTARMQRDYEIAAMMTASLRSTLAHMKLHRPLTEVFAHHAYCDADAAMHSDPKDPRYGIRGLLAYLNVLANVNLQHAPVVRFRYVGIDPGSADTDAAHSINLTEVWGMCLPAVCDGGLGRGTTYKDDLFAAQAPLTDQQMLAEAAIMAMTTEAFWEQAARENGIIDIRSVAQARELALKEVNREFYRAEFSI